MKKILIIVEKLDLSIMDKIEAFKKRFSRQTELVITDITEKRDFSEFDLVIVDKDFQKPEEETLLFKIRPNQVLSPLVCFVKDKTHKGHERPYKYHR